MANKLVDLRKIAKTKKSPDVASGDSADHYSFKVGFQKVRALGLRLGWLPDG